MANQKEEGGADIQQSTRSKNWGDMPRDVLTHIFTFMCMTDVVFKVSGVCRSWRKASNDPVLWKTLDLELFTRKFIYHSGFFFWVAGFEAYNSFGRFFKYLVRGNHEILTKLVISGGTLFNEGHLLYMAERTPNLEHFAMPTCPLIRVSGLKSALKQWPKLESISIAISFYIPHSLFKEIGENCKNIIAIKIVDGEFNMDAAQAMVNFLQGLKIVTLRCFQTEKDAVEFLLDNLTNLEELYISDKVDVLERAFPRMPLAVEHEDINRKASRLQKFHVCQNRHCSRSCPTAPGNFKVIKK